VGILWQSGDIYPAQEHFVTFTIRQKIIAATDALPNSFNPNGKKFLMLLPEGEWHEIGLLIAQNLVREAGHEVIYLGQSVPYSDVLAIGSSKNIDAILISNSTAIHEFDLIQYLKDLGGAFPDKKILFMSPLSSESFQDLSPNHIHLDEIDRLTDFLSSL